MSVSDEDLCNQVRAGSASAFSELWYRHRGEALGYARKLDSSLAEDAVADVMATLFESLRAGKGPDSSFRSYLLLSIRNRIYRGSVGQSTEELPEEFELAEQIIPITIEVEEDAAVVHEALGRLPDRWREVLVLSEVQGLSLARVGQRMGLESNAVSALLRRARAGLRRSWVAAHFSGAKLGTECSNVVEAFGEFRWGKPSERQRVWFERHVSQCSDCSERHGTHAWLAQAVGLALLPLVWLGGSALTKAPKSIATNLAKPAVYGATLASTVAVSAFLVIASLSTAPQLAIAEPNTVDSPRLYEDTRPSPEGSTNTSNLSAESSEISNARTASPSVQQDSAAQGETTEASVVPTESPSPAPSPPPSPTPTPSPIPSPSPVRTERIQGSSRPGASIEFLLSDATTVIALADSNGDFWLDIPWPADKPTFSYVIQRVY